MRQAAYYIFTNPKEIEALWKAKWTFDGFKAETELDAKTVRAWFRGGRGQYGKMLVLLAEISIEGAAAEAHLTPTHDLEAGTTSPPNEEADAMPTITPPALFLGRETERAKLAGLLADTSQRLISVVSIGGMGKTTLVRQVACDVQEAFPGRVFWNELENYTSYEAALKSLVVSLVGASEERPTVGMLVGYLRQSERVLLVLDNVEQLLEESDFVNLVAKLRDECPNLTLLVTSRQRLRLRGEEVFELRRMEQGEALKLFRHHMQNARSSAIWDEEVAQEICRRLDGWPALLCIAASHVQRKSLQQVRDLLPTLGVGGSVDQEARFRSLQALLADCCAALSVRERGQFFALSVFEGSFVDSDALTVAEVGDDLLETLTARRLLGVDDDSIRGVACYRLPEPFRWYARQTLTLESAAWERHTEWCLVEGERELARLRSEAERVADWILIETDADRQAAQERAMGAEKAKLLSLQGRIASRRGRLQAALALLKEAVGLLDTEFASQAELSFVARELGDIALAERAASAAQTRAKSPEEQVDALALRAYIAMATTPPDFEQARALLQKSQALAEEHKLIREQAKRCWDWGIWAQRQATIDSQQCQLVLPEVEKGITLYKGLQDRRGEAGLHNALGSLYYHQGEYPESQKHYAYGLSLVEGGSNTLLRGALCYNLGEVAEKVGELAQAVDYFGEAVTYFQQSEHSGNVAQAVAGLDRLAPR